MAAKKREGVRIPALTPFGKTPETDPQAATTLRRDLLDRSAGGVALFGVGAWPGLRPPLAGTGFSAAAREDTAA